MLRSVLLLVLTILLCACRPQGLTPLVVRPTPQPTAGRVPAQPPDMGRARQVVADYLAARLAWLPQDPKGYIPPCGQDAVTAETFGRRAIEVKDWSPDGTQCTIYDYMIGRRLTTYLRSRREVMSIADIPPEVCCYRMGYDSSLGSWIPLRDGFSSRPLAGGLPQTLSPVWKSGDPLPEGIAWQDRTLPQELAEWIAADYLEACREACPPLPQSDQERQALSAQWGGVATVCRYSGRAIALDELVPGGLCCLLHEYWQVREVITLEEGQPVRVDCAGPTRYSVCMCYDFQDGRWHAVSGTETAQPLEGVPDLEAGHRWVFRPGE